MHPLKVFLSSIEPAKRHDFAKVCGTSLEQLKHIYSNRRKCNHTLAIKIDKHSGGAVRVDDLCPDTDWDYIRQQAITQAKTQ